MVFLEPSVAQPPLPLQEFLPLQPLSLVLQPPLPLQEFWPLQACFSFFASQMLPEDCPASAVLAENPCPLELEDTVLAPAHLAALERLGPTPLHRRSFHPVVQSRLSFE